MESSPNHNSAHGFIGGPFGQISFLSSAVEDPFFFQLHGNVDRLWANWQRNPSEPGRVDPVTAYGPEAGNARINATMSPWDGDTGLAPWNTVEAFVEFLEDLLDAETKEALRKILIEDKQLPDPSFKSLTTAILIKLAEKVAGKVGEDLAGSLVEAAPRRERRRGADPPRSGRALDRRL